MTDPHAPFHGAKLVLTHKDCLLTYLRDDFAHIPFPAQWDLPGGGREGSESAIDCALRELAEEFGLSLAASRLSGRPFASRQQAGWQSWLFMGTLTQAEIDSIRFGDEGQEWRMMPVRDYLSHPRAVPHFQELIRAQMPSLPEPPAPLPEGRRISRSDDR